MEPFVESGMTFGPFPEGHCFRLEVSDTYRAIQQGVSVAEFLLIRLHGADVPPMVWIVEAKQSSPRPATQPNFRAFIGEIRDKLVNALTLGVAAVLGRHPKAEAELPERFKTLDLRTAGFRLLLIINGHEKAWLPPLQDALRAAMRAATKTWAVGPDSVLVVNHEIAKRHGIISAP